jgi:hypothetical protein
MSVGFVLTHAMRERSVLNDTEWTGWIQWMTNCFKYGTIRAHWNQIESRRWLNPAFETFVKNEVIVASS